MTKDGIFQARQILTGDGRCIENAFVAVRGGIIVDVSRAATPSATACDLGEATLIPGLVNAHTHLEFSCLDRPLGQAEISFTEWLKQVIDWRMDSIADPENKTGAIRTGIRESIEAGVVLAGEITTLPVNASAYRNDLNTICFLERLTRDAEKVPMLLEECTQWLSKNSTQDNRGELLQSFALSPHAPYSVHPKLMYGLVDQAVKSRRPLAMHLAETREELQLLSEQSGPFVDFLQTVGAWYPETYATGQSILDYLKCLEKAPRSLIVHGNYLLPSEIEFIANNSHKMSVVYCPRTHAYFDHTTYPLKQMLEAKINVAVGTDSRASNPDLSIFEELKFIKQQFPALSDHQILELGTCNGAQSLGVGQQAFWIAPGSKANFNVILNVASDSLFGASSTIIPIELFVDHITQN